MLSIIGPAVQKKQYTRIPMTDGLGDVSAYVNPTYVDYRVKGGTDDERLTRTRLIAAELGGTLVEGTDGTPLAKVVFDR